MLEAPQDLVEQQRQEIARARQRPKWRLAVQYLRELIPDSDIEKIRTAIRQDRETWFAAYHFGWGMWIRNKLREQHFAEDDFGITNLDNIYVQLIEEAVANGEAQEEEEGPGADQSEDRAPAGDGG